MPNSGARSDLIKSRGIEIYAPSMFVFPTETPDDSFRTVEFYHELGVDHPFSSFLMPFPDTKIYEIALEHGTIPPDIQGDRSSGELFSQIHLSDWGAQDNREYSILILLFREISMVLPEFSLAGISSLPVEAGPLRGPFFLVQELEADEMLGNGEIFLAVPESAVMLDKHMRRSYNRRPDPARYFSQRALADFPAGGKDLFR